MEFRELKSLLVLAQTGSLSETARLVHLTPAAIHKQLKHLEAELQVPLYEKANEKLRLTAAAQVILPYLRDIAWQEESALSALEEWKGVKRGLVRVGAGPSLATYLLPRLLIRYYEEFPNVDIDVQTGNSVQLLSAVENGDLDLVLVVSGGGVESSSLHVEFERAVEILVVTSLSEVPARVTLKSLSKWPFLSFSRGSRIEALITNYWNSHGLSPNAIMSFDSAEALKATLTGKLGVAMMPSYAVERELKSGELRRIRTREAAMAMQVRALSRSSGYAPPALRRMIELAKETL
jgi:DNA-binding transcriptional LysR family regulator